MENFEFTEEEKVKGQEQINAWFDSLPKQTADLLRQLEEKTRQMETFDLLSNISVYNHMHDTKQYSDYREDRMFVVSELIALIALKKDYVAKSTVDIRDGQKLLKEIQELGNSYFGLRTAMQMKERGPKDDYSFEGIAYKTMRDETAIRNPGLPEHHLMFSAELYAPLEGEIKKQFGFSIKESIELRNTIVKLINEKVNIARKLSEQKAMELAMEVFKYRATKTVAEGSNLTKENLEMLNNLSRKQIKEACYHHCINDMVFHLGDIYCFTPEELAAASNLDLAAVTCFLKEFSCTFPCVAENDELVGPTNVFKSKPLVAHNNRYLLPSMPLLTWCVEPAIEAYFKSVQKLQDRYSKIKGDFLLTKGCECLSSIFSDNITIYTNLYYNDTQNNRCETDGVFRYERTLFILEAKAHRISQPAKEGKVYRVEKHLEQIVKESYEQGLRTLHYIRSKPSVEFLTENNKKVVFSKNDFDEVVLISLVLEPIGSITPLIRATNELGYFKQDIFPWIVSIYDLLVIADHFEFPILLPHYIKRRREFLERKIMYVFEELDLMSYYLFNRLYIERMFMDAESKKVNKVHMDNETDAINNYYMQKYRYNNPNPPKVRIKLPNIFLNILGSLHKSQYSNKQELMTFILDMPPGAMEKLESYIVKVKNLFARDAKMHDCSILTHIWGKKVGFTFMTGVNKLELDTNLNIFCPYKMGSLEADVWIGLGDTLQSKLDFEIQSVFLAKRP